MLAEMYEQYTSIHSSSMMHLMHMSVLHDRLMEVEQ